MPVLDGHTVRTTATAAQALQVLDQNRPNLVLLDFQLGGATGALDLRQHVRARVPDLPIVLVSAYLHGATR